MYDPTGVKTSPEFPVPDRMKAWVLGSPDELFLRDKPMPIPGRAGEWTGTLLDEGWSCYIEQGRYGFPVRKATWLYAVGTELPPLRWGRVNAYGEFTWMRKPGARPRVASPRNLGRIDGWRDEWAHGYKTATSITPPAFRDVLLAMARSAAGAVDE